MRVYSLPEFLPARRDLRLVDEAGDALRFVERLAQSLAVTDRREQLRARHELLRVGLHHRPCPAIDEHRAITPRVVLRAVRDEGAILCDVAASRFADRCQ